MDIEKIRRKKFEEYYKNTPLEKIIIDWDINNITKSLPETLKKFFIERYELAKCRKKEMSSNNNYSYENYRDYDDYYSFDQWD